MGRKRGLNGEEERVKWGGVGGLNEEGEGRGEKREGRGD